MSEKHKLLLVDDDQLLSPFVIEYLEAKNFQVDYAQHGDDGLAAYRRNFYNLLILDVKMPFKDGFTLAQKIREKDQDTPIIFVTGEGEKEKRIHGLTIGADDYLVKPYSMEELYLRIKNLLKRSVGESLNIEGGDHQIGDYTFNPAKRELSFGEEIQVLTTIETRLLLHFLQSKDKAINKETAMRVIWEDQHAMRGRSLTVYVSKLRQYLNKDPRLTILNIHGSGYRLVIKD